MQPPTEVLEQILAVRLHLDDCDESNGALRVVPGSHRFGRLSSDEARRIRGRIGETVVHVECGEAMLMRPLLLHASSKATSDRPRRVLHYIVQGLAHLRSFSDGWLIQLVRGLVQDPARDRARNARLHLRPSQLWLQRSGAPAQILSEVVDDLHAALKAGAIPGPYILVGHSLGGIEVRLYAQRWPKEVAGMVLVDSSPAGEMLLEVNLPDYDEAEGRESYAADMLHCALLAAHGSLEPSRPEYKDCTSVAALPSDTPAAFRKIWPQFFTADYFADKVSLMSSLYTHRYDSADHLRLGAMPLIVLTATNTWGDTPAGIPFTHNFLKFWLAQHEALAHLSSRGIHRFIKGIGSRNSVG